jgi:predicted DNA-binding transcriptional regulator AlpA
MPRTLEDDKLLTAKQAAALMAMTTNGLSQQRFNGTGPQFVRFGVHTIRYWQSDIQTWLDSRLRTCTLEDHK